MSAALGPGLPPDVIRHLRSGGPLESIWVPVAFAAAIVVCVAFLLVRRTRRRRDGRPLSRPVLRRIAAVAWLTLLLVLGTAAAVNRYVGYVPSVSALTGQLTGNPSMGVAHAAPNKAGSRLVKIEIPAPRAGMGPLGAYVYLPPGYDSSANSTTRYPVVYLIHGSPGWPVDWFRAAGAGVAMDDLLAHHLVRPMIIVSPAANRGFLDDSECLDAVGGPHIETFLTRDVVSFVDAQYRTVAQRAGRAIGGISAGGYCALNLALRHQQEYSVVLAHMPYGDPGSATQITPRLLGGDPKLYVENSPRLYLPGMRFSAPIAFFLDAGSKDTEVLPQAKRLAVMLTAHHQIVDLRVVPGEGHTWRLGRDEVPFSLSFASGQFDAALGPAR